MTVTMTSSNSLRPHSVDDATAPAPCAGVVVSRRAVGRFIAGVPLFLAAAPLTRAHAAPEDNPSSTPATPGSTPATDPASDPALTQTVEENEPIVEGEQVVLDAKHVDIGPRLLDGEWILAMRDDTASPQKWRLPKDVVLQVHDAGKLPVPEGEDYAFLGAEPGSDVYVIPQTEVSGVIWLGWNTQDPAVVKAAPRGMTLRVTKVEGPGEFSLFLQPGNFAPPQVLAQGSKLAEQPADIFVDTNTHTHANWVFTKPGVYVITMETRATGGDGTEYADSGRFRFAVGDATSVEEAQAAGLEDADDAAPSSGEPSPRSGASDGGAAPTAQNSDDSHSLPWIIAGGVAVLAAGGGGVYAAQRKKAHKAAGQAREQVRRESGDPQ